MSNYEHFIVLVSLFLRHKPRPDATTRPLPKLILNQWRHIFLLLHCLFVFACFNTFHVLRALFKRAVSARPLCAARVADHGCRRPQFVNILSAHLYGWLGSSDLLLSRVIFDMHHDMIVEVNKANTNFLGCNPRIVLLVVMRSAQVLTHRLSDHCMLPRMHLRLLCLEEVALQQP